MAKTQALGTKLYIETAAGPPIVYGAIGHVTAVSTPSMTRNEIDVTTFDSSAKEFLGGLPDNGTISFSGVYDATNAGQTALFTAANAATAAILSFKIDLTLQAEKIIFPGYVASFAINASDPDGAYTYDGSIRVTGAAVKSALP